MSRYLSLPRLRDPWGSGLSTLKMGKSWEPETLEKLFILADKDEASGEPIQLTILVKVFALLFSLLPSNSWQIVNYGKRVLFWLMVQEVESIMAGRYLEAVAGAACSHLGELGSRRSNAGAFLFSSS